VHAQEDAAEQLADAAADRLRAPLAQWLAHAPEFLAQPAATWDQDFAALGAAINRFAARGPGGPWAEHPAFGPLTGRMWGVLAWRHLDHHLRQFGL
jgi:hypothetical protein